MTDTEKARQSLIGTLEEARQDLLSTQQRLAELEEAAAPPPAPAPEVPGTNAADRLLREDD